MSSTDTIYEDPVKYAREATRWGLAEPEAHNHPEASGAAGTGAHTPPMEWTSMEWMLESRRACLAWVRKATQEDLAKLVKEGTHPKLVAQQAWPLEPDTLKATLRTARQALATQQLRSAVAFLIQKAKSAPGTWIDLGAQLPERDAMWVRDMVKRSKGMSAKVDTAPGATRSTVLAYMIPEGE